MAFDTTGRPATAWDEALKPLGYETVETEPFEVWLKRHRQVLAHLHPKIAEQWIYKHWTRSPYKHLPINKLRWRLELWPTDQILSEIFRRPQSGELDPEFDYDVFHARGNEPGLTMDRTGTWNYPILVLETPDGVDTGSETLPAVRYCLIEGHQRLRYLNALHTRAKCAAEHEVFVLSLGTPT